jgi:type I restriction-modification system DNA methylase subunit
MEPFETAFLEQPRLNKMASKTWLPPIDLVIGNPPYGEYMGYYKSFMPSVFKRFEFLFVYLGLKALKKDGILVFIVSQNFMNNGAMYKGMKEKILELGTFVDAVRLPNGIFSTTDVGTDIIIFKRK